MSPSLGPARSRFGGRAGRQRQTAEHGALLVGNGAHLLREEVETLFQLGEVRAGGGQRCVGQLGLELPQAMPAPIATSPTPLRLATSAPNTKAA